MRILSLVVFMFAAMSGINGMASELNRDEAGLALAGYDPVEYLEYNRALKGFTDIETILDGTRYRFRNRENQALFVRSPEKYLPAYGGWCPYGLAMDESEYPRGKYPVDPNTFRIINGKVHLFYNQDGFNALEKWDQDESRYRKIADREWAVLMKASQAITD